MLLFEEEFNGENFLIMLNSLIIDYIKKKSRLDDPKKDWSVYNGNFDRELKDKTLFDFKIFNPFSKVVLLLAWAVWKSSNNRSFNVE